MRERFGICTKSTILVLLLLMGGLFVAIPGTEVADQDGDDTPTAQGSHVIASMTGYLKAISTVSAPEIEWSQTYGGPYDDLALSTQQTNDGGYIVAGYTHSSGTSQIMDAWLVKTDSSGNTMWSQTYGGSGGDMAYSVQQTSDGGYIFAGSTYSYGAGGADAWLVKADASGNMMWSRTFGGTGLESGSSVQQTQDGGYIVASLTRPYGADEDNALLIKTDASGNMMWSQTYGGAEREQALSVQQTSDGGYIFAGWTGPTGVGSRHFWLVKTDSSGNMNWSQTYGGTCDTCDGVAKSVQQTQDGGYIVAGWYSFSVGMDWDFWLVKTDSSGNMNWSQTYGGSELDLAYSVQQTSDGGYIVAGYTNSYGAGQADAWLVKADASGNMMWSRTIGGSGGDMANSVQQTSDGGYIFAGSTYSYGAGNYDFFLVKLEGTKDTDGDGLLDDWEQNGVDGNKDGTIDLDLKASGADWQHKDIFVEVDYMDLCRPDPLAISDVQIAFNKAPVDNPDGTTGINLHVLVDQKINRQLDTTWSDFDALKSKYFGTAEDQASSNKAAILEARELVSHYCLFAFEFAVHNGTTNVTTTPGNAGSGELLGNDFMVTLGYYADQSPHYLGRMAQASVFMHELGHNLGLGHGGKDDINFKPNYLSIMNYMFQFNYLYPNRPLDFSRTELNTLNEAALNEMDGVGVDYLSAGSGGWLFTGYKDPIQNKSVLSLLRPIDWDGDNFYNTSVRANVNNCTDSEYKSKPDQMLDGNNDWENIILPFQNSSNFADGAHGESPEEMTIEVMMLMEESALHYHDVALVNATLTSTVVDQNGVLDVTVRSANLGANNETADLSVYAGTTLIAQRTVSLERSNITSTTLRCDVSTVPKGDQVITVRLTQVPGEEDAFDNNYTYGAIEFTGETAPQTEDQFWPLILGVSVTVVAVIAIALFVVLRKRGKKSV